MSKKSTPTDTTPSTVVSAPPFTLGEKGMIAVQKIMIPDGGIYMPHNYPAGAGVYLIEPNKISSTAQLVIVNSFGAINTIFLGHEVVFHPNIKPSAEPPFELPTVEAAPHGMPMNDILKLVAVIQNGPAALPILLKDAA